MTSHEWTGQAACGTTDPELWFSTKEQHIAEAKAICAECPVRRQCADRADQLEGNLSHSYRHGIWAGEDTHERAAHSTGHHTSYKAAQLRKRILAMPGVEAVLVASTVGCTPDHVWRVRRLNAAQQKDMGVAA
ncbi:WhiB family transcriptional regulator [Streptomyces xanthophaeus]|uniref:WhiB family transcriptional regulator n=1 Tax=Streptomyces xanthophaeus TaxID=67385 RepID=UPI00398F9BE0